MNIDFTKVTDIVVDGIDYNDAPDYCDAYIDSCDYNGRPATSEELDAINENSMFVYEAVMENV